MVSKRILILTFLTGMSSLQAYEYRGEISNNALSFQYQNINTSIDHQEVSDSSSFTTLGEDTSITGHGLMLEYSRELFTRYFFSLTIGARYGRNLGSTKGTGQTYSLTYRDKISGSRYGAGASLNMNFSGMGLKIQPFAGFYYDAQDNKYELNFYPTDDSSDITTMIYEDTVTYTQLSLGVRFIDYEEGLMSNFSFDYMSVASEDVKKYSSTDSDVSNFADLDRRSFAFTFGFGVLF